MHFQENRKSNSKLRGQLGRDGLTEQNIYLGNTQTQTKLSGVGINFRIRSVRRLTLSCFDIITSKAVDFIEI